MLWLKVWAVPLPFCLSGCFIVVSRPERVVQVESDASDPISATCARRPPHNLRRERRRGWHVCISLSVVIVALEMVVISLLQQVKDKTLTNRAAIKTQRTKTTSLVLKLPTNVALDRAWEQRTLRVSGVERS